MALLSLAVIVGPSFFFIHTPLKNLAQLCWFYWVWLVWDSETCCFLSEFVWVNFGTSRSGYVSVPVLVLLGKVGAPFRSDFPCLIDGHCGLTVRSVERCKAICHWSQPVNVIQFYMNSAFWEVGRFFFSFTRWVKDLVYNFHGFPETQQHNFHTVIKASPPFWSR